MNKASAHFKAVCDEMNFTRSAENSIWLSLCISCNKWSRRRNRTYPFDRISKIYLTEMGKIFLNKTLRILELYNDLENNFYSSEKMFYMYWFMHNNR